MISSLLDEVSTDAVTLTAARRCKMAFAMKPLRAHKVASRLLTESVGWNDRCEQITLRETGGGHATRGTTNR